MKFNIFLVRETLETGIVSVVDTQKGIRIKINKSIQGIVFLITSCCTLTSRGQNEECEHPTQCRKPHVVVILEDYHF